MCYYHYQDSFNYFLLQESNKCLNITNLNNRRSFISVEAANNNKNTRHGSFCKQRRHPAAVLSEYELILRGDKVSRFVSIVPELLHPWFEQNEAHIESTNADVCGVHTMIRRLRRTQTDINNELCFIFIYISE